MPQESTPTTVEAGVQEKTGIQQGLADRTEALHGIAQIRENLGQVAAGHEVHTDASRVVLTNSEVQAVAHGETDAK